MLKQPVSSAILELPLSRDLDLDHKLELHCFSSSSAVLSAMQDCFLLNQEITSDPILKQHTEVLVIEKNMKKL